MKKKVKRHTITMKLQQTSNKNHAYPHIKTLAKNVLIVANKSSFNLCLISLLQSPLLHQAINFSLAKQNKQKKN